ncbi:MAG: Dabb family protein [Acidobacteria bacterium]|nr:Dabb family protein [Acidobacteriota bacterium]
MSKSLRLTCAVLLAAALFAAGYVTAQNKFNTPGTIIHISLIKWKAGVSDADKQKALDGVRDMAAQIPGIKNVWLKATRMQPRDYHAAFVIEFENRDAAEAYAEHPVHAEWSKFFLSIREASISPQITN